MKILMDEAQLQFYLIESERSYDDIMEFQRADKNKTRGRRAFITNYINKPTYPQQLGGIMAKILNNPPNGLIPCGYYARKRRDVQLYKKQTGERRGGISDATCSKSLHLRTRPL